MQTLFKYVLVSLVLPFLLVGPSVGSVSKGDEILQPVDLSEDGESATVISGKDSKFSSDKDSATRPSPVLDRKPEDTILAQITAIFKSGDRNGDGSLSLEEFANMGRWHNIDAEVRQIQGKGISQP